MAAATRISFAGSAPPLRPRRVTWDDPADAKG
jgi:hypothetical protein